MNNTSTILSVDNVQKQYPVKGGFLQREIATVKAVDGVSFTLKYGETLGLVGESGCGKSTLGRAIMFLERPSAGTILFDGVNLSTLSESDLRKKRKDIQIIFQDPFSSLNPKMTVFQLLAEPILNFHPKTKKAELEKEVHQLMSDVGLRPEYATRYPHEFSGGQRQRISIGRALASRPKLIVCDEPVSALDVSIQAQILNLLMDLQEKYNFSYIFISHDLHVVRHTSKKIAVMYLGRFVELANSEEIFTNPLHPYTKSLLSAIPTLDLDHKKKKVVLQGDVPSPLNPPNGCHFHPRCPVASDHCSKIVPELKQYKDTNGNEHWAACLNISI
ncbi:MAG: hypothetical protein A2504_10955 [Bdellovibrionales bacterium RIFOXYD12_FULL_39_22]|nr:MAG: hypothetical protein A2385_09520 [Bdellovibrionales bacterium RIFOXYB1_FULL_39_21]OFZ44197.1 MAG: hypothetical protein A2485_07140 [Bdellovibrionales bacterium RIFOXYC12_FULL_39_17]OFZ46739.1 MAG: hypothetical protein A2404_04375 [Bdellovibrionales bacterium RIFOXYC1_FULL_39_130]OFZ75984.1 MAG: hypothetical protein A2560_02775 [Bdellovibrionales bacterium RIFOXYD1_FULL_39_84]OFZ95419.1 MAG: hypothetical protein A2504_10955 [Bdellovibrionales bacterium RIFOXYD12_FULL_39_22]HLE09852.1 di